MKTFRFAFLSPFFLFLITSCDLFEKSGNIEDYVGSYVLDHANEKTYHVAWNNKTLTKEQNILEKCSFTINSDCSITFIDKDGKETIGKVKVLEKYCRFKDTPLDSDYKYYLRYDNALYYSYESSHASVEYDVTYREILFVRK